jgi:hypothetical protein
MCIVPGPGRRVDFILGVGEQIYFLMHNFPTFFGGSGGRAGPGLPTRGGQYHFFVDIISYQYHGPKSDILSCIYH